jgi:hypothetical protein
MNRIRCMSCRTLNDRDQSPTCAGCGRTLETAQGPLRPMPLVQHEASRDGTRSGIALAVLGFLSILSMIAMIRSLDSEEFGAAILFTFVSVLLVGGMIWIPLKRRISASRRDDLSKAVCFIMAFIAAIFGSGLLVFLTCAGFAR